MVDKSREKERKSTKRSDSEDWVEVGRR